LKHTDQLYSEIKCNFPNCMKSYSTVYSTLFRCICTAHIESDKRCKTNNKESNLLNELIIKATSSQDVNLIKRIEPINLYAASLEPILNKKRL